MNSVASGPILIVDDDAPSRTLVRELVEGAGYSTIEIGTGVERPRFGGHGAVPPVRWSRVS